MPDEMTPMDTGTSETMPAVEGTPEGGAARTTNLAIIIGAILAFIVVAGLVAAAVFVFVLADDADDLLIPTPPTTSVTTTPTVDAASGEPIEPDPVALSTVFTFRDIFDPLLDPLPEETTSTPTAPSGTPNTPGSTTEATDTFFPEDMLVLLDIVEYSEGYAGVFYYNEWIYVLAPGGRIPDSPWQLVSVSPTEVVMLYGDDRVTLTIGSRVAK